MVVRQAVHKIAHENQKLAQKQEQGDKKAKLIAERDEVCAPFMSGAK